MSNLEDASAVRALAQSEINKMTNAQLKKALATLVNANPPDQGQNDALLDEIRGLRQDVRALAGMRQEVDQLSQKLDQAFKIISQQQTFLETLDANERRRNLIITGLTEETNEVGGTDAEKVRTVIAATGHQVTSNPASWQVKRLGQKIDGRKRLILVVLEDGNERNEILKKAKNLKSQPGSLATVYIKKDVHPAVRKEMARLRQREKDEKEKAENVGVNIRIDWKKRELLRDGNVIDKFLPYFF